MPRIPPPVNYRGTPCSVVLSAGTQIYRVHRRKRSAADFCPVVANTLFGGGRFDPIAGDEYPYLYASLSARTALTEVLLRGLSFNDRGTRFLPRVAVQERRLSSLEVTTDLTLVTLMTSPDLAAIGQDAWLIHADPPEYPQTRYWGQWLRQQAPWAHGLLWPSKRDVGEKALILFGDRCPDGSLRPGGSAPPDGSPQPGGSPALGGQPAIDLDDEPGRSWLNQQLAGFRITVRPPARPRNDP
jgi:hypothetical protein